jgi:ATP-binding cassette subfamily F protein 1
LFVVSHDQDFLNSVCQEILHIEDLKLISYKGNYDSFKKTEKERLKQNIKAWEKQEKRLRELKRSGQSRAKATENVKQSAKRESGARSSKKKNSAIGAGIETAVKTELIKRPREYAVKISFSDVPELSRPVMEVNNVHFRYSPKHPVIFDKIDFGIDMDSRICIVGPNGAGKSVRFTTHPSRLLPVVGNMGNIKITYSLVPPFSCFRLFSNC